MLPHTQLTHSKSCSCINLRVLMETDRCYASQLAAIDKTRQEDYIIPASLADSMFDPSSGSTVCNLFMPASKNLATCNRFGCHMNCCIV